MSTAAVPMASKPLAEALWISLASLLRSHVEMRALGQPAAGWRVLSVADGQVEIESRHRKLRLTAPGSSGSGTIALLPAGGHSSYCFAEDGRVCFAGRGAESALALDMEAAVEHLLDEVHP